MGIIRTDPENVKEAAQDAVSRLYPQCTIKGILFYIG